jgi:hypothetical protein
VRFLTLPIPASLAPYSPARSLSSYSMGQCYSPAHAQGEGTQVLPYDEENV